MVRKVLVNPTSPASATSASGDSAARAPERATSGVEAAALRGTSSSEAALGRELPPKDVSTPELQTPPAIQTPGRRTVGHDAPARGRETPLPAAYRGKASGEFQRVIHQPAVDTNGLIAEAERQLLSLPASDRNRRLLEVAILRRDPALLRGLLQSLAAIR